MRAFSYIIASLLLGLSLMGATHIATTNLKAKHTVVVKGLDERIVRANIGKMSIDFAGQGSSYEDASQAFEKNQQEILGFFESLGFSKDELSVSGLSVSDRARYDRLDQIAEGIRYTINASVHVRTTKIDQLLDASQKLVDLLKRGVLLENIHSPQYQFTLLNEVKPAMLANAVGNAQKAAKEFAKNSDSQVGKIIQAYQGSFSISNVEGSVTEKKVRVVTTVTYELN
jgi:hypothetical protein